MALVTRQLINTGDPLYTSAGAICSLRKVYFELVRKDTLKPVSLFDALSGEYVTSDKITVTTDAGGLFSVLLWPNDRGEIATAYRVSVDGDNAKPTYIYVASGVTAVLLIDARALFTSVAVQDISVIQALLNDVNAAHLAAEADATAAATSATDAAASAVTATNSVTAVIAGAPAETVTTVGGLINGAVDKAVPVDADAVGLSDSVAAGVLKKLTWANIKATLKTYFDGLYPSVNNAALTGVPTAPTAVAGTNTTQISTTAFVAAAVASLVNSSPAALDTLNELATALGNDPNFATTVTNALAAKAPLASPALTGTPTAPTAAGGMNNTQVATTAFVKSLGDTKSPLAGPGSAQAFSTGLLSSPGIVFPASQVASADPNTLDDYEEGTWTPTLSGTDSNPAVTYTAQFGKYTKIGNIVICHILVSGNITTGGAGSLLVTLPFIAVNSSLTYAHTKIGYVASTNAILPTGISANNAGAIAALYSGSYSDAPIPAASTGTLQFATMMVYQTT